jgi:hypothetical protein
VTGFVAQPPSSMAPASMKAAIFERRLGMTDSAALRFQKSRMGHSPAKVPGL